jgi:tryptophan 2-monooxygenase
MALLSNIYPKRNNQTAQRFGLLAADAGAEFADAAGPDFVAWPYVDTLYDYIQFLGGDVDNPEDRPIATLPKDKWGTQVAIIGAGAAGLMAAYQLLKIGAQPVIFEASGRIGGRAYSHPFTDADGQPSKTAFAELGSMRFPPSGKTFFYYAKGLFKLMEKSIVFPDPGKVPTVLYYQNKANTWNPGGQPEGFEEIAADWSRFIGGLVEPLYAAWRKGDLDTVRAIWQRYISKYKDMSFYAAVREGIPSWSDDAVSRFGALGIGSGGFGPLYEVGFVELLRIVVNMWEDNQELLSQGVSRLMDCLYTHQVTLPDGSKKSLEDLKTLRLESLVKSIEYDTQKERPIVQYVDSSTGKTQKMDFAAVIVATTSRSMEMLSLTLPTRSGVELLTQPVKRALRNVHLMSSSKMFIRTETKFWLDEHGAPRADIPQNIQTDELPRGVYVLDYPQTANGVVLISYTWGDDSVKLTALAPQERFEVLKQAIAKASPRFAEYLVPMMRPGKDGNPEPDILNIDWDEEENYFGAFKLQYPGQEPDAHAAYYQYLSVLDPQTDRGVYLAGDSVSWSGGWTEGAFQTGINAACAAAKRIGASLDANSPLSQNPAQYNY